MSAQRIAQLLARLEAIGTTLAETGQALALIGLVSVGVELERLDEHSDLDFFVIVEPGAKRRYLDSLDWLERVAPIAYLFRNTDDGYKVLFADDIFCELAVFEPDDLANIPYAEGRIVWRQPHVDPGIARPPRAQDAPAEHPAEWLLGEALTNLYVGLGRYWRGEKLSAMRFIQGHAVDRVLELSRQLEAPQPVPEDRFVRERRYERRFPGLAGELPSFLQGYERSPASALALLEFIERHFALNAALAGRIRDLCMRDERAGSAQSRSAGASNG